MSSIAIDSADLIKARTMLAGLSPIGAGLTEASRPLGHLHDRMGAQIAASRIALTAAAFLAEVHRALPGIASRAATDLWRAVETGGALRPALQTLVDRALDPLAGLTTYPDPVVFTPAELAALVELDAEPQEEPPARGAVTGIVKVTRHCNLRCTYCHDWRTGRDAAMSFPVLARTMRWLVAGAGARRVNVVLHGGEPALLGIDRLIKLLALQARYRPPGTVAVTRMQSNGTLLTAGLVDAMVRYGVASSISLDGPPEVHDRTRLKVSGAGSSTLARAAIARLDAAGILNGVLMVVTPALLASGAERLVSWLAEEKIGAIALLPMRPAAGRTPRSEDSLPTADFCRFLLDVEVQRQIRHPDLWVRELDAAHAAMRGENPGTCELQGFCVGYYVSIEPDGTVSHCDKFVGDPSYRLGSVFEGFDAVTGGEAARRLRARARGAAGEKRDCRWWNQCRGWCPHEDYVAKALGVDTSCCGLATLFDGLADRAPVPAEMDASNAPV